MREVTFKDFDRFKAAFERAQAESAQWAARLSSRKADAQALVLAGCEEEAAATLIEASAAGVTAFAALTAECEAAAVAFLGEARRPGEVSLDCVRRIGDMLASPQGARDMFAMQARNSIRFSLDA